MTRGGAGTGTPIRYLDRATVTAHLPGPAGLIALAEVALRSLASGAEVPPKAGLTNAHGVFAHAMPAGLARDVGRGGTTHGAAGDALDGLLPADDLLGMKWIAGGPANRAAGLPAMSALIVLSDAATGLPAAILEGGLITAWRTAALSAVAIRTLARRPPGRAPRVVLLGAGAQGHAHLALLGAVLPDAEVAIHDRHPERAEALASSAVAGVGPVTAVPSPEEALRAADVVVSATALGGTPDLHADAVGENALLVPVDYGARVAPGLACTAAVVAVDDPGQYDRNRAIGRLPGWPDATDTLGDLLERSVERAPGRAIALHQGPAVADLVVAAAVARAAQEAGSGILLAR